MMAIPLNAGLGVGQSPMLGRDLNIAFGTIESEAAYHKSMAATPNQVAPPSFTDELAQALSQLDQIIGVTCSDAELLRERLFGGWPEANTASGSKGNSYPGNTGALLDMVQTISARAVRLNETVQILNNRI